MDSSRRLQTRFFRYKINAHKLPFFFIRIFPPTGVNKIARGGAYSRNPWGISENRSHPEGVPQFERLCDPIGVGIRRRNSYQGFTEYSSPLAILLSPVGAKIQATASKNASRKGEFLPVRNTTPGLKCNPDIFLQFKLEKTRKLCR